MSDRRSGRTTRQLALALTLAREGKDVMYVTTHIDYCLNLIMTKLNAGEGVLTKNGCKSVIVVNKGSILFVGEAVAGRNKGKYARSSIVTDHYVVERRLENRKPVEEWMWPSEIEDESDPPNKSEK